MVGWKKILRQRSKSRVSQEALDLDCDTFVSASIDDDPLESAEVLNQAAPSDVSLPEDVRDYYYPDLDKDSATDALQRKPVGTFLLRKSQCPNAVYTLSVRSQKHVFNVRIFKKSDPNGPNFHLDAPNKLRRHFPSVDALLRYYSQAPKELVALCIADNTDERSTFRLQYPLSRSMNSLDSVRVNENERSRPVTRQMNGGSLKAMVKWL